LLGKAREFFCSSAISRFGSNREKTIPESGQANFRKCLWLIPFILAKKLLTKTNSDASGNFSGVDRGGQNGWSQKLWWVKTRWLGNNRFRIKLKVIWRVGKFVLE
jgi:hypothetical protein